MASSPSSRDIRSIGKIQQAEKLDVADTESTLNSKALNVNVSVARSSTRIYEAGRNEEKQDTEEVALSDGFRDPDDDSTMIVSNVQQKDGGSSINIHAGEKKVRDVKILAQDSTSLIPAGQDQKLLFQTANDSLTKPTDTVRKEENRKKSNDSKSPENLKGTDTRSGVPSLHRLESLNKVDPMLNALVPVEDGLYGFMKSLQHIQCDSLLGMDPVVEQFNEFFQEPESSARVKREISPVDRAKRQEERKKKQEERKKKLEEKKMKLEEKKMEEEKRKLEEKRKQEAKKEAAAEEKKRSHSVAKNVEPKTKPAEEKATQSGRKASPEGISRNSNVISNEGEPPKPRESRTSTNEDIVESPIEVYDAPGNRSTKVVVDRTVVDEIKKSVDPTKPRESTRTTKDRDSDETREENDELGASKKKSRPGLPSLPKSLSFWRKKKKETKETSASGEVEVDDLNTGRPPLPPTPPTNFKARDEVSSGTSNWSTSAPKYDRPPAVVIVTNPPNSGYLPRNQRPEGNLSGQKEGSTIEDNRTGHLHQEPPNDDKRSGNSHQEKIPVKESSKGFATMKATSAPHQKHDLVKASIFSLPASTSAAKGTAAVQTSNSDEAGSSKLPGVIVQNKTPLVLPTGGVMSNCPTQSSSNVEEAKFAIGTAPKKARRRKKKRRKKRRNPLEERKRRKFPSEGNGKPCWPGSQGETGSPLESKDFVDKPHLGNLSEENVLKSLVPDNLSKVNQESEPALQALKASLEKSMAEKIKLVQDEAALEVKKAALESSQKASEDMNLMREHYEKKIKDAQIASSKSAQELEDARNKERALQRKVDEFISRTGAADDEKAGLTSEVGSKKISNESRLSSQCVSGEAMPKEQCKTDKKDSKEEAEMAVSKLKIEMEGSENEELKEVQEGASSALKTAMPVSSKKATQQMKVIGDQHDQNFIEESLSKQRVDLETKLEEQRKRCEEQANNLMEINTGLQNSNAALEKETKSLTAKLQEVESLRSQEHHVHKEQFQETEEQKTALVGQLARAMKEVDELMKAREEVEEIESLRVQNAALTSEIKKMKLSIEAINEKEKQRLISESKSEAEASNSKHPVVESKPESKVLEGDLSNFYSYYSEQTQRKEHVSESAAMKLESGANESSLENGSAAESIPRTHEGASCLQLRQQQEEVGASEDANLSENSAPIEESARAKELEGQVDRLEQEKQSMLKAERAMSLRLTQLEQELGVAKSAERAAEELRSELGNTQKMVFDIHNAIKGNVTDPDRSMLSLPQPVLRKESEYDRLITEFDRLMPSHPGGGVKKVSFSTHDRKEGEAEDEEVKWFSQSRFEI